MNLRLSWPKWLRNLCRSVHRMFIRICHIHKSEVFISLYPCIGTNFGRKALDNKMPRGIFVFYRTQEQERHILGWTPRTDEETSDIIHFIEWTLSYGQYGVRSRIFYIWIRLIIVGIGLQPGVMMSSSSLRRSPVNSSTLKTKFKNMVWSASYVLTRYIS